MQTARPNHYAALGLDRRCSAGPFRAAYRVSARQHQPVMNPGAAEWVARTQALNAAYETLSDPDRRRAHDCELDAKQKPARRAAKGSASLTQDVHLRIEEFFRGTTLEVRVNDPAHVGAVEVYPLTIPPETAPGTRFRITRTAGGVVVVRVKMRADFRFKVRGADLRCDLRIKPERAAQGGAEMIRGATGTMLRVPIPRGVARGEIIRLPGEGLPRPRGGRGDLLVRINYRVEVRITRAAIK
ncbi:MAG: DnaJ domain-containing protein [Verrucomicrobia bacterium]|nr:DnaJ domain-containing protein [Verrucomicrobiota bacterium]